MKHRRLISAAVLSSALLGLMYLATPNAHQEKSSHATESSAAVGQAEAPATPSQQQTSTASAINNSPKTTEAAPLLSYPNDTDPAFRERIALMADVDASQVYLSEFNIEQLRHLQSGDIISLPLPDQAGEPIQLTEVLIGDNQTQLQGHLVDYGRGFGVSLNQSNKHINGYIITPEWRYDISTLRGRVYVIQQSHQQAPEVGLSAGLSAALNQN